MQNVQKIRLNPFVSNYLREISTYVYSSINNRVMLTEIVITTLSFTRKKHMSRYGSLALQYTYPSYTHVQLYFKHIHIANFISSYI